MDCFPADVRRKLDELGYGEVAAVIEKTHTQLLKHRQPLISVADAASEEAVTIGHLFVLWQAHLHRIERLMVSCGSAVANNDPYGLAALIRAHLESTAVVTSIASKLQDRAEGRLGPGELDDSVTSALMGSRWSLDEQHPKATNILTHIRHADRFVDAKIPMPTRSPISEMYAALSEYAHPNMPSNMVAFSLAEPGVYRFEHRAKITPRHAALLGSLGTSSIIFVRVSEFLHGLLKGPSQGAV